MGINLEIHVELPEPISDGDLKQLDIEYCDLLRRYFGAETVLPNGKEMVGITRCHEGNTDDPDWDSTIYHQHRLGVDTLSLNNHWCTVDEPLYGYAPMVVAIGDWLAVRLPDAKLFYTRDCWAVSDDDFFNPNHLWTAAARCELWTAWIRDVVKYPEGFKP